MATTSYASALSDGYNISIGCLGLAAGTVSAILCYKTIRQIDTELKKPFMDKEYRKALENSKKWYKILTGISITGGVLSAALATSGVYSLCTREDKPQKPDYGEKPKDENNPNKETNSEKDKNTEKKESTVNQIVETAPISNKNTFIITENELQSLMKMKKQFEKDPENQYNVPIQDIQLSEDELALSKNEKPKPKPVKQQPKRKGLALYFRPDKVTAYIEEFHKQYNVDVNLPEDGSDIEIIYPMRLKKKKSKSGLDVYSPVTKLTQNDFFDFRGQLDQTIERLLKNGKKRTLKK